MAEATDIDAIDDILEMAQKMAALGVSAKGLRTVDEMKERLKEALNMSRKKSSWTAKEAFFVLTEAKKEDERKRETLHQFYEKTEVCLDGMDDKIRTLLEQNIRNLKYKIAMNKRNLKQKEYIVLVAGETSSGKSTLLNLILGEQLLPYSILSTTSTICELKYGATPKLVAHFKDKDPETGKTEKTLLLSQSMETSQQSYLDVISSFVHVKTNREKGSYYKKIELFWPHSLLQQGIVLVDSPGIGESKIMDDMVQEYLPKAFAFIYVINSANAGGIQEDRVEKLIEQARNLSLDQQKELIEHAKNVSFDLQKESPATQALFVCNKWDQVPPGEADEVKKFIIGKLTKHLPSLDPDSQIIYMSSTIAGKSQVHGIISDEFAGLMDGIKSMVLKSIEARLQTQWRWLDYLISRMAFYTKAFIHHSYEDRSKVERMASITERLEKIEKQESSISKDLQEYLDKETNNAVRALSKYLKSSEVVGQFTSWTLDDVPNSYDRNNIRKALMNRLKNVITAWEDEHHVLANVRTSLFQYFQQRFNVVEGQLRDLESSLLADDTASSESGPQGGNILINLVLQFCRYFLTFHESLGFEKDKCTYMANASMRFLAVAADGQNLWTLVVEQLKEVHICLKQVVTRIPELIGAEKMLFQLLRDERRAPKEIERLYKPLCQGSLQLRKRMALFCIKEVRTTNISRSDLEWNEDGSSLLGTGAFGSVYRGKLKQRGEEQPVALKFWTNEFDASVFLAETETLRKLNHPLIVKFYGAALLNEGDRVKAILVMELCKEDLRRHIFQNPENIPGLPSLTPLTNRNTIRWAKDIADALKYVHKHGFVHRDLKLENILITHDGDVKIADVGVTKQANMITGTFAGTPIYLAPEVIRSSVYDSKADIYSFGIMMWEMWYGTRAFSGLGGDLLQEVAGGVRPSHVEDRRKPPDGWQHLMQWCWDGDAEKRPTAAMCHKKLTKLYQEAV